MDDSENSRHLLLRKLVELAQQGPVAAVGAGDTSVGMTLLESLAIDYTSAAKPNYSGIVVSASRRSKSRRSNRVNLFAQVPDWEISTCKSSREIVEKYGYTASDEELRLYCTVRSRVPNSQGLYLEFDHANDILREVALQEGQKENVVGWKTEKLEQRLVESHPESIWVKAVASHRGSQEYFHYREATYTGPPNVSILSNLIEEGTITVDHLILRRSGRVREKGPLFKIDPNNLEMLFPAPEVYDLMATI